MQHNAIDETLLSIHVRWLRTGHIGARALGAIVGSPRVRAAATLVHVKLQMQTRFYYIAYFAVHSRAVASNFCRLFL
jgi:hypothetical protein